MDKNFRKAYYGQFTKEKKVLESLSVRTDKELQKSLITRYASKILLFVGYFVFAVMFYTSYAYTCKDRSVNTLKSTMCDPRHWNVLDSFYFAIVTMFTVGWTDLYPSNENTKIATILLIVFGFFLFTSILTEVVRIAVIRADASAYALDSKLRKHSMEYMKGASLHEHATGPRPSAILSIQSLDAYAWLTVSLALVFIGAGFFCWNEQWAFLDAVYFCLTAATTVAYSNGTGLPTKDSSLTFLCVYIPVCVLMLAYAAITGMESMLTNALVAKRIWRMNKDVNTKSLRAYYDRPDLRVGKHEFCLAMMLSLGNVCEDEIELWMCRFEELDREKKGHVTSGDATNATAVAYMNRRVFQELQLMASSERSSKQTMLGRCLDTLQYFLGQENEKSITTAAPVTAPAAPATAPASAPPRAADVRTGQQPDKPDVIDDARSDKLGSSEVPQHDKQPEPPGADDVTDLESGPQEVAAATPQAHLTNNQIVTDEPAGSPASKLGNAGPTSPFRNIVDVKVVGPSLQHLKPGTPSNKPSPAATPGGLVRVDSVEGGANDQNDADSSFISKKSNASRKPIFRRTLNVKQVAVTSEKTSGALALAPERVSPERVSPAKDSFKPGPVRGPKLGNVLSVREREISGMPKEDNVQELDSDWDFYARFNGGEISPGPRVGAQQQGLAISEVVETALFMKALE